MRDSTKRMFDGDLLPPEEQPDSKKPNVVAPFSHDDSSFQPLEPFCNKSPVAEGGNNIGCIDKSTPDHVERKPIDGGGATSKADDDDKAAKIDDDKEDKATGSGFNTQQDMDPIRLKRVLANRAAAQRSRIRQNEHVANLEEKRKFYQSKVEFLQPQVSAYANHRHGLLIEHHKLKLQMAIHEKERLLKEVEIEKAQAELNRLSEKFKKQTIEEQARKMNMRYFQFMPNSNMNPSGFRHFISSNSNQAQNGAEASIPDLNVKPE